MSVFIIRGKMLFIWSIDISDEIVQKGLWH